MSKKRTELTRVKRIIKMNGLSTMQISRYYGITTRHFERVLSGERSAEGFIALCISKKAKEIRQMYRRGVKNPLPYPEEI